MTKYFISYKWYKHDGNFGFGKNGTGNCVCTKPIRNIDDIREIEKVISKEEKNANVIIIFYREFNNEKTDN